MSLSLSRACDCGAPLTLPAGRGRAPSYCSNACRQRAYRERKATPTIPAAMTERIAWTRRDHKRPLRLSGFPASSTDRSTWSRYDRAKASTAGDGLGIMLGDGLGCYDLDHVTDAEARSFAATITEPVLYAERSMSGEGVHIFIEAPEANGWKRTVDGLSVERYTRARFIAVTGQHFPL